MNHETARLYMIDRLYNELLQETEQQLEEYLQQHPELLAEWQELCQAHGFMQQINPPQPAPALQEAILQQKTLVPEPERRWFRSYWKSCSAAAMFLMICSLLYFMSTNEILQKAEEKQVFHAEPDGDTPEQIRSPGHESPQFVTAEGIERGPLLMQAIQTNEDPKNAEEHFRTALKNYDKAFTKIGEERNALLRSAIVFLRDIEEQYPEEKTWLAMSYILVADAYRSLNEPEECIRTFEKMIEKFDGLEPYCEKAKASLLEISIQNKQHDRVEPLLDSFLETYSLSSDLRKLTIHYIRQIEQEQPAKALKWYERILLHLPHYNMQMEEIMQRIDTLRSLLAIQTTLKHAIRDWWMMGPLEAATLPYQDSRKFYPITAGRTFQSPQNRSISWEKFQLNENAGINLREVFPDPVFPFSVIATTFIYSPENQFAVLAFNYTNVRIWINKEMIIGNTRNQSDRSASVTNPRNLYKARITLKKGWNELTVKPTYYNEKLPDYFVYALMDENGNALKNVRVQADKNE